MNLPSRGVSDFAKDSTNAGIAQRQSTCLVSKGSGYRNSLPAPYVAVAQLVEHLIAIQKVAGSNPVSHSSPPFRQVERKDAYSNYLE